MIWLALGLGVLVIAPFLAEALKPEMTSKRRRDAPGDFADLPEGLTHFQWRGPADGPVLVLVHGLTTPEFVWDGLAPKLAEAGFRVLSYDHIGRGFSERNGTAQSLAFFEAHLVSLLRHEGVEGPFLLAGFSMGGAVAAHVAARHPERVARLVLIAPGGVQRANVGVARRLLGPPFLGKWLFLASYGHRLRADALAVQGQPTSVPNVEQRQAYETRIRGFIPAVYSSLRHSLGRALDAEHRAIAANGTPVLAIWGERDDVIPLAARDELEALNPSALQVVVPGADHGLPYTHTGGVFEAMRAFMSPDG